jgi:hypothetical protein
VSLAGSFNVIGMEIILRILMQARCDPKKMWKAHHLKNSVILIFFWPCYRWSGIFFAVVYLQYCQRTSANSFSPIPACLEAIPRQLEASQTEFTLRKRKKSALTISSQLGRQRIIVMP